MMMSGPSLTVVPAFATVQPALRQKSADLAVLATAAAVLSLFAISPITLEHFEIAYLTPGGSAMSKVHPATVIGAAAFLLRCFASNRPLRSFWTLGTRDAGSIVLLLAVAITSAYAVVIAKTPVTPLIDTFVLPVLFFLLLRDLNPKILKWLALLVALIFCVNAVMAMIEFFGRTHIVTLPIFEGVSSDPTRGDAVFDWRAELMQDWRATALLGHPLANGLIVGCLILCLAAPGSRWLPGNLKGPLLLLQCSSMFAFGARLSLVLTFVFGACLALQQWRERTRRDAGLAPRDVAIILILSAVLIGVAVLAYATGIFDRTFDRFVNDEGSARTRTTMLQMFQPLNWSEIILGPNQEVVATWQRLYGLEFGIESSWIGLALNYGVLVTCILLVGLLTFFRSLVRVCGRGTTTILLFYLISVSGTASLSGKTTSLAMAATLAMLFLQQDERRCSLRDVLSARTV